MWEMVFFGGVQRFLEAGLQAAPTIAVGLLVAGVFRRLLGPTATRRLFGDNTWRSFFQAWALGMLLPVCSVGTIPILRELRRAGVSGGAILAFALSAPLFNPLSILYGLTLSRPMVIISFALASLGVVTVLGIVWDRLFPNTNQDGADEPPVPHGWKRIVSIGAVGARELAGPSLPYILIALVGMSALNGVLPHGSLQHSVNHDNPFAPVLMLGVSLPAYATPMLAMSQLGMMFQHGNSVGAAFVLLVLGTGVNLGLIAWIFRTYGVGRSCVWLAMLIAVVLGIAYAIDKPLYPDNVDAADHTHAFDVYCCPFLDPAHANWHTAWQNVTKEPRVFEWFSVAWLGGWFLWGAAGWAAGGRFDLEAWFRTQPSSEPSSRPTPVLRDITIPGPILGAVAIAGLVVLSIVGCYAYYPPKEEIFQDIAMARTEALVAANQLDEKVATNWIEQWDDLTRKLQVSVFLREWRLTDYQRIKAQIVRQKIELLEHEVEHGDAAEVAELVRQLHHASRRLRDAFR